MVQTDLQKEFNLLVKEISNEVLKLTISKSIENSSLVFEKKIPELNKHLKEMQIALDNLKLVSNSISSYEGDHKKRDNILQQKFTAIQTKIDEKSDSIKTEIKQNSSKMKIQHNELLNKNSLLHKEVVHSREMVNEDINKLGSVTNQVAENIGKNNKLTYAILLFSIGSFGILLTMLLNTLGVVAL